MYDCMTEELTEEELTEQGDIGGMLKEDGGGTEESEVCRNVWREITRYGGEQDKEAA